MSTIEIGGLYSTIPNSADGVGVRHRIYNASDKVIKYITFTYLPYNSVGDLVSCQLKKTIEASGKLTEPLEPMYEERLHWEVMWYNPTISNIVLKEVIIQFMDDSIETIPGDQVLDMDSPDSIYKKQENERKAKKQEEYAKELQRRKEQRDKEIQQEKEALKKVADAAINGLKGLFKKK